MICALVFASLVTSHSKPPAWLDRKLAGYLLVDDEKHTDVCVYDQKTGFILERGIECDGGIIYLVLTRDRNVPATEGYIVPGFKTGESESERNKVVLKSLPSLSTGKGVTIGDTPKMLESRLGRPTRIKRSGSREQFLDYVFEWSEGKGDLDSTYTETFTFKAGRLIEINFLKASNSA